jgi:catechol 2,3-dioxygenase-like lactoylglutathione lyase family enzyme
MVNRLGHVGIFVRDLEKSKHFYAELLGLEITDENANSVFLSARPEVEHHELLLVKGRAEDVSAPVVQQISFRCDTLEEVIEYYFRLQAAGVEFKQVVSHGIAIGIYFYDPDHNGCEVYWSTGLTARQPYLEAIDLTEPVDVILAKVTESVLKNGATGIARLAT